VLDLEEVVVLLLLLRQMGISNLHLCSSLRPCMQQLGLKEPPKEPEKALRRTPLLHGHPLLLPLVPTTPKNRVSRM
jgi:hypothetical protein